MMRCPSMPNPTIDLRRLARSLALTLLALCAGCGPESPVRAQGDTGPPGAPRLQIVHQQGGQRLAAVADPSGERAYVGVGPRIAVVAVGEDGGLEVRHHTAPLAPLLRETIFDLDLRPAAPADAGDGVGGALPPLLLASVAGGGVTGGELIVLSLDDPDRPVEIGRLLIRPYAATLAPLGRYVAVHTLRDDVALVDLADPSAPREVTRITDFPGSVRDLAALPEADLLYVLADDDDARIDGVPWIVDVSVPAAPEVAGRLEFDGGGSMAVDAENGLLWVVALGDSRRDQGAAPATTWLRAFDLSDPRWPAAVGEIHLEGRRVFRLCAGHGRATVGTRVAADPSGHAGLLHLVESGPEGLRSVAWYEGAGLPSDAALLGGDHIVSVHDLGMDLLTVADLENVGGQGPPVMRLVERQGSSGWWKHLALAGDRLYAGNEHALQVFDIEEEVPRELGSLQNLGERVSLLNGRGKGMAVHGEHVLLADRDADVVRILDVADPEAPRLVGRFASGVDMPTRFTPEALTVQDDFVYVAAGRLPLLALDIARPEQPTIAAILPSDDATLQGGNTVAVEDGIVFLTGSFTRDASGRRLLAVDIHRRAEPAVLGMLELPGESPNVRGIAVKAGLVLLSVQERDGGRLRVADFRDPRLPRWLPAAADIGSEPHVLVYRPPLAYVLGYPMGLAAFDLSDPASPRELDRLPELAGSNALTVAEDGRIFVAVSGGGLVTVGLEGGGVPPREIYVPIARRDGR